MQTRDSRPKRSGFGNKPFNKSAKPGGSSGFKKRSFGDKPKGSFGGSSRSGSSFGKSGFKGRSGGGRRGPAKNTIDYGKFINKAKEIVEEVYTPEHTFNDFKIDQVLKDAILARGYIHPSPIQDKSIPSALERRDVIGLANTGTGKTAAFLIPTINHLLKNPNEKALIVAPTRELALQIGAEFRALAKGLHMFAVECVGGANIKPQIYQLHKKHNLIIGTPGRIKDLFMRKDLRLDRVHTVVLDEADRMLDMGFIDDVRYFLKHIPEERQMLLYSATLAPEIERLIKEFLREPVKVSVKTRDTSAGVDQDIVKVPKGMDKIDMLHELLVKPDFKRTLIFAEMKHSVEKLTKELIKRGFKAASIHGDKSHSQRQVALKKFKSGEVDILLATDVAARGLDIHDVTHIINYEIPQTYDTYIHRIGRTGRAGKKGFALTFVS